MANLKNAKKPRATALSHLATPDHKKSQDAIPKLSIDLAEAKHLNPYVEHVAKRLRALRKRMQKIEKMEEKVKSLAPHEINEEQKAVLAKKPELSITMKELTEIVDNLVQISKNPPVEEKTEEKAEEAQEQKQEETQIVQQPSEEVIPEEIPVVTEAEAEAQAHSETQNDVQDEDEIAEKEDNSAEKHFENPELFQALNFFSSLLSTYFNKSLPISPDDYQSLELFRSVVLSGDFERPDGRQAVIEHLQKLTLQSEDNVTEEYPVTYQQVHKVVSSISELNSLPPQENGDQEHQYQYESEKQTQPVEKEIQVFNTVSRPPGGFNFMTTSEILENHQAPEEPELPVHQEIQEIQDQPHNAFPEPQQYNAEVNYGNDQWDQYQDQINYKQDTYQQFPSADGSNEAPLVSQAGFENPLSALMGQPSSDSYPPQHAQSSDLPSQNDQDNVPFNDNQRNWQRRTNRDYRRNNNANYGGKSEYRHNYQYENNYDSNGNIGANNQYRTNPDKYRNRSNWNQNQSSPNAGDHSKSNSGHYGYNNNQNTFRNSRNHNPRSYGGNYRGPRDGYDGMISQNHNSGYQH